MGRRLSDVTKMAVSTVLPVDLVRELTAWCEANHSTKTDVIELALRKFIAARPLPRKSNRP